MSSKTKFLLAIISIVVVILIFSAGSSQEEENTKTTPQPTFKGNSSENLPIQLQSDLNLNIPTELPTYIYTRKLLSDTDAKNISNNLNLSGEPIRAEDVNEGVRLIWTNQTNSFIASLNASHIKYSSIDFVQKGVGTQMSDDELKNIALEFISSKFNFDRNTIDAYNVKFLKKNPSSEGGFTETTKNNAHLIQVDLNYKTLNLPILTDIPQQPLIFAQFNPNGEIYRAEAYLIENILSSNRSFPTKTLDDIKTSISKATLISIENDYLANDNIKSEDITNIEIEKVETGYYFDKFAANKELIPVFLLSGKITIRNSTGNYARLYMPAYK